MAEFRYSNRDENRFWLEIMGDSALMLNSRLPSGRKEADEALYFFNVFNRLEHRAMENPAGQDLDQLNRDAYNDTLRFRTFLLGVLKGIITENAFVLIKPVYISHMATLSEEYMYLLGKFIEGKTPAHDPVVQDIFWLPMLYTEARYISDNVGLYQRDLKEKADAFAKDMNYYFLTSIEMQGFLRVNISNFEIANRYRIDLLNKIEQFMRFVQEVITIYQKNGMPGTISLLQLDSLNRKLCYYSGQLAVAAGKPRPACSNYGVRLSTV